jgi:hypothetical protein
VHHQFLAERPVDPEELYEAWVALPVGLGDLGGELIDSSQLSLQKVVVRALDVIRQLSQAHHRGVRILIDVLLNSVSVLQLINDTLSVKPSVGARVLQGTLAAAAVIDSELLEDTRTSGLLNNQFSNALMCLHRHEETPFFGIQGGRGLKISDMWIMISTTSTLPAAVLIFKSIWREKEPTCPVSSTPPSNAMKRWCP